MTYRVQEIRSKKGGKYYYVRPCGSQGGYSIEEARRQAEMLNMRNALIQSANKFEEERIKFETNIKNSEEEIERLTIIGDIIEKIANLDIEKAKMIQKNL